MKIFCSLVCVILLLLKETNYVFGSQYLSNVAVPWEEADDICHQDGGALADPSSLKSDLTMLIPRGEKVWVNGFYNSTDFVWTYGCNIVKNPTNVKHNNFRLAISLVNCMDFCSESQLVALKLMTCYCVSTDDLSGAWSPHCSFPCRGEKTDICGGNQASVYKRFDPRELKFDDVGVTGDNCVYVSTKGATNSTTTSVKADENMIWGIDDCEKKLDGFVCQEHGIDAVTYEYPVYYSKRTWADSQSFCSRNGTLGYIYSKSQTLKTMRKNERYWIGLYRRDFPNTLPNKCAAVDSTAKTIKDVCTLKHRVLCTQDDVTTTDITTELTTNDEMSTTQSTEELTTALNDATTSEAPSYSTSFHVRSGTTSTTPSAFYTEQTTTSMNFSNGSTNGIPIIAADNEKLFSGSGGTLHTSAIIIIIVLAVLFLLILILIIILLLRKRRRKREFKVPTQNSSYLNKGFTQEEENPFIKVEHKLADSCTSSQRSSVNTPPTKPARQRSSRRNENKIIGYENVVLKTESNGHLPTTDIISLQSDTPKTLPKAESLDFNIPYIDSSRDNLDIIVREESKPDISNKSPELQRSSSVRQSSKSDMEPVIVPEIQRASSVGNLELRSENNESTASDDISLPGNNDLISDFINEMQEPENLEHKSANSSTSSVKTDFTDMKSLDVSYENGMDNFTGESDDMINM